jgi:hypothetical protein
MPADDISSFDVSALDALMRLEAEQRAIRALSEKASARRAREAEIYARVTKDYETRMATLVEQAEPIRQRLREDLQKIDALMHSSHDALNGAKGQLQECEFRHEIGEFDAEAFKRCQQVAQAAIKEKEAAVESVKALRQRYVDLMPAAAAAPVPAPPAVEPPRAQAPAPRKAPAPAGPSPAAAARPGDSRTAFLRPPAASDFEVPAGHAPEADSAEEFRTMLVASAMLVEDHDGLPGTPHRLGPATTIGRTADNQIVVPLKEVSRNHARIVAVAGGYVLKDLGSPNGTFVNGERVQEHKLQDGDKIVLGPAAFTFKAS